MQAHASRMTCTFSPWRRSAAHACCIRTTYRCTRTLGTDISSAGRVARSTLLMPEDRYRIATGGCFGGTICAVCGNDRRSAALRGMMKGSQKGRRASVPALGHGWVLETQNQYRVGGEEVLAVARASTRRCSPLPTAYPGCRPSVLGRWPPADRAWLAASRAASAPQRRCKAAARIGSAGLPSAS